MTAMPPESSNPTKQELRSQLLALRHAMDPRLKQQFDKQILERLLSLPAYGEARLLLTYISTPLEVDTRHLIDVALSQGKQVAVPRCVPGTRELAFHLIHSLEGLRETSMGILEPGPEHGGLVTDYSRSICIVPGLSFDGEGYRLGYGGGYYDRFLAGPYREGYPVGVCYQGFVCGQLPREPHDRPVRLVVTQET